MKRIALMVLCASMIMACDDTTKTVYPPIDLPIGVKPGTRLQPKLLLADDGTQFLHPTIWRDSEYGECQFRTAADGQYRCLPDALAQPHQAFLDSSCLQEVFLYIKDLYCVPMSVYGLVQTATDSCGGPTTVHVYKPEKTVPATTVYWKQNGTCSVWKTLASPNDADVYVLNEEIPAGEFVSAWR